MKTVAFLYVFLFAFMYKVHAHQPLPKTQQQPKDCVKHPEIVKKNAVTEKAKTPVATEKTVKSLPKSGNSVPHYSVLNFINFFYTKDTLDNLRVM